MTKPGVPFRHVGPIAVKSTTFITPYIIIPGVVSGAAYASGDAVGLQFEISVPYSGIIQFALFIDQDKEQIAVDVLLFDRPLTTDTADNGATDIADADMRNFVGFISISTSAALNDNAIMQSSGVTLPYVAPSRILWAKVVTRGAPNLTAVTDYALRLAILPDDPENL